MAKFIKTIVDTNGNTIFPRTRAKAIIMADGVTDLETVLSEKADISHAHEGLYCTVPEVNALLLDKSDSIHTHDGRYYTETEADALLVTKVDKVEGQYLITSAERSILEGITALTSGEDTLLHTHDSQYYTKSEVDTANSGKANISHTHSDLYLTAQETTDLIQSIPSGETYDDTAVWSAIGNVGAAIDAIEETDIVGLQSALDALNGVNI